MLYFNFSWSWKLFAESVNDRLKYKLNSIMEPRNSSKNKLKLILNGYVIPMLSLVWVLSLSLWMKKKNFWLSIMLMPCDLRGRDKDNLKPIVGEIRTITRGPIVGGSYKCLRKAVQRQANINHVKHPMAKHRCIGNDDIVFFEQDVKGIKQPHDDSLVIMLTIEGFNTWRMLVDNGSSEDVMYMMAFQQMKLDPKCLKPFGSPLVSFNEDRVYPKDIISL